MCGQHRSWSQTLAQQPTKYGVPYWWCSYDIQRCKQPTRVCDAGTHPWHQPTTQVWLYQQEPNPQELFRSMFESPVKTVLLYDKQTRKVGNRNASLQMGPEDPLELQRLVLLEKTKCIGIVPLRLLSSTPQSTKIPWPRTGYPAPHPHQCPEGTWQPEGKHEHSSYNTQSPPQLRWVGPFLYKSSGWEGGSKEHQ